MWIIETNRTQGASQTIAGEVLGYQPGVGNGGRLGTEIALGACDPNLITDLLSALREGGHAAEVTSV